MVAELDKLAEGHEDHIRDTSKAYSATAERLQVCPFLFLIFVLL